MEGGQLTQGGEEHAREGRVEGEESHRKGKGTVAAERHSGGCGKEAHYYFPPVCATRKA